MASLAAPPFGCGVISRGPPSRAPQAWPPVGARRALPRACCCAAPPAGAAAAASLAAARLRRGAAARRGHAPRAVARRRAAALRQMPELRDGTAPLSSPLRFSSEANWVAPGHLMVGRYPYTDPNESKGRALMRKLVQEAKVSTFLCVQSEVPPQADVSGWPPGGVKTRSRRCLRYAALAQQLAKGRALHFLHEPLGDLDVPDPALLAELVGELERRILGGEVVLVHCMGGRGRSATVAACALARLYSLSGEEAMRVVQAGYDSRDYDNSPSPETEQQRRLVVDFCGASGPTTGGA